MHSNNGELGVAVASANLFIYFSHSVGIKVGIFNMEKGI